MIAVEGQQPPGNIVAFWERVLPGIWSEVIRAANAALSAIDTDLGETVVTSWFRSVDQNRRVGGDPDSQHLFGLAFDIVPGKGTSRLAINEAAGRFAQFGFTVVPDSTHVHVQVFPRGVLRAGGFFDALRL